MKVGKFLTLIAVLAMATSAMAANVTLGTGSTFQLQAVNPVLVAGVAGNGLVGFTLRAVNIGGSSTTNPNGVDASPTGPYNGISSTGKIHQNMLASYLPTKAAAKTASLDSWAGEDPADVAIDTHWMVDVGNIAATISPTEDGLSASPWASPNYYSRWGNYLRARFGRIGAATSATWDMAYIVVPCCDTTVNFDLSVAGNNGTKNDFDVNLNVSDLGFCAPPVPAPAALPLGIVGLLWIRRRS